MERALQGSAKDGALLFSAYITAIRLSVDVLLLQIFMRLSHDNIISAVFHHLWRYTNVVGTNFRLLPKIRNGWLSQRIHILKNIGAVIQKFFLLKIDTPCSRILRKWNKSANNMTIVSAQVSYLRKHLKIHICGWGNPLKCNQYDIASVWKLILEENCTNAAHVFCNCPGHSRY